MTPDRRFRPDVGDHFAVQWHRLPDQPVNLFATTCVWECVARQEHMVVGAWAGGEAAYRGQRPVFNFDLARFHAVRPETLAAVQGRSLDVVHAGRPPLEVAR